MYWIFWHAQDCVAIRCHVMRSKPKRPTLVILRVSFWHQSISRVRQTEPFTWQRWEARLCLHLQSNQLCENMLILIKFRPTESSFVATCLEMSMNTLFLKKVKIFGALHTCESSNWMVKLLNIWKKNDRQDHQFKWIHHWAKNCILNN